MIKAICFDVGGTLIGSNGLTFSQRLTAAVGIPMPLIREKLVKHFYLEKRTFKNALNNFCRDIGVPFSDQMVEEILGVCLDPVVYKDAIHCLNELNELNEYSLATISNCTLWEVIHWDEIGMQDIFELEIRSFEVGLAKPNPEMFCKVEKRLGLEPTEILMVGDSCRDDIAGAKIRGWKAVQILRDESAPCLIADHVINSLINLKDIIDYFNYKNFEGR